MDSTPSHISLSGYSGSSFRKHLPDDLDSGERGISTLEMIAYTSLIDNQVDGPGYYCSPVPVVQPYREIFDLDVGWIEIGKSSTTGEWDWSVTVPRLKTPDIGVEEISYSGSRNDFMMSRLRHDIVAMGLGADSTDVALKDVFKEHDFQGAEGTKSPDIVFHHKGVKYIIEIGTSQATEPSSLMIDFSEKVFKYDGILSEINHYEPCVFLVIIVGQYTVVSNHHLPNIVLRVLTFHMRLGVLLERKLEGMGLRRLTQKHDSVKDSMKAHILQEIKSIPIQTGDFSDPLDITGDFIESLKTPSDRKKVFEYFSREFTHHATRHEEMRNQEMNRGAEIRDEYISKLRQQESRSVPKSALPLPLVVIPKQYTFDSEFIPIPMAMKDYQPSAVINLWRAASRKYNRRPVDHLAAHAARLKEMYEEDPDEQARIQENNKEKRRMAHRASVKGELTESDLRTLALDGIWAKKYNDDDEKLSKYVQTKLPWNWDTNCTDIESFLSNSDIYTKYEHKKANPISEKTMRLVRHSLATLGQKENHVDDLEEWFDTKIVGALSFLGDIVHEITISAKQYVNQYEVIIKKLAYYEAYLLIIPTKPNEHIFFSIYIPGQEGLEVLSDLPFRKMRETFDGGFFTDFCSFRADKLENAATITERFLASAAYWSHHYGIRSFTPSLMVKNYNSIIMSNFTLLITLENKQDTEEVITVTRYMYMEVMKSGTFVSPFPSRLISKLTSCPRSRIALFVIRRVFSAFEVMTLNGVSKIGKPEADKEQINMMDPEEDVLNADQWVGLVNPYTLSCETSGSKIVMLFYLGYAISKNLVAQQNSDYQTIEKAIREDRKFNPAEAHKSNGSWDEFEDTPKDKQFSINVVKFGVEMLMSQLRREVGDQYKEILFDNILRRLADHMTYDLASTKASANIDHVSWDSLPTADKELASKKGRLKVIEAIVKEIGLFEHNPYLSLNTIISIIQLTSQGLICDLFKKNQHGGIREIYVLTIKSRILALFVETCARELCSHFDQETMTHPDHKLEVIEAHKAKVAHYSRKTGNPYVEFHCSADKAKWNNNLSIVALSTPLFMLLPESVHGCIQTILNMWTKRLVKVPTGVLRLLMSGTQLSCPTYQEMLNEFDEPGSTGKQKLFTSRHSPFAILRTGMMQGILHYTSSLLHVAFLASTRELMMTAFQTVEFAVVPFIDQMCSSDDSATIISVVMDKSITSEQRNIIIVLVEVLCQVLTTFCQYSCFTNSDKSTMGAPHQLEFNSEFIITNTLAVPTFKWLLASLSITESESLYMRSVSFYNLLSQVYAAGLPAYHTAILQIIQAILHYRLLGSNTCAFFDEYATQIERYPDPHLGYFIMDNIHVPGALGYGYHHWLHSRTHQVWNLKKKSVLDGSLAITPDGGITDQFLVHYGDSRRYHALLDRMKIDDPDMDLREEVTKNYPLLYREAMSQKEAIIKLRAKALTPGTAQSLSRGVAFLQAVSISVYMLFTFCFSRHDSSYVDGKLERKTSKISLMGELHRRYRDRGTDDYLTPDQAESAAFPNAFRCKTYLSVLTPYFNAREIIVTPMRYKKSVIRLPQATSSTPVDLFTLVKEKWFGYQNRYSVQNKDKSWDYYKGLMPWLSERIEDTLRESPFQDHIALYNFVSTLPKNTRRLARVGPAIRATFPIAQVNQLARRTWKDGVVLELGADTKHEAFRQFRDRRTSMGLALEIPNTQERERMVAIAAKNHPVSQEELEMVKGRHRREAVLAIIVGVMQGIDDDVIKSAIEQIGHGLFLGWTSAQTKHVRSGGGSRVIVTWSGAGELTLCNRELTCIVTLMDDKVIELRVNSVRTLMKYQHQVLATLSEQKLKLSLVPLCARSGKPYHYTHHMTKKGVMVKGDGPGIMQSTPSNPISNPDLSNLTFSVSIQRGRIILKQRIRKGASTHTVFTHSALDHEFCASQSSETLGDVWMAWFKQARMSFPIAKSIVELSAERVRRELAQANRFSEVGELAKETEDIVDFLSSTLRARLRHKSYDLTYLPDIMKKAVEEEEESWDFGKPVEDFLVDLDLNAMRTDWFSKISALENYMTAIDCAEAEHNDMVSDALEGTYTMANLDQFYDSLMNHRPAVDIVTNRLTSKYSVLPFWDPFIETISAYNPLAWNHLLSGREVAGIGSQLCKDIIWILLRSESRPMPVLSRDKEKEVNAEAVRAIYAGSISSRNTGRTLFDKKTRDDVLELSMRRLQEIREISMNDDLLDKIMNAVKQAHDDWMEKTEREESERPPVLPMIQVDATSTWVESGGKTVMASPTALHPVDGTSLLGDDSGKCPLSSKLTVTDSDDSDSEESSVEPMRNRPWEQMVEEENFEATPSMFSVIDELLTDRELNALWILYRKTHWQNDIADTDMLVMMHSLRAKSTGLLEAIPDLDARYVYYCLLGSEESGHWVCFVTGSPLGDLFYFDGLNTEAGANKNFQEALSMFQAIQPSVTEKMVNRKKIPKQTGTTCGHLCALWALHYLRGIIPPEDCHLRVKDWVKDCFNSKSIIILKS